MAPQARRPYGPGDVSRPEQQQDLSQVLGQPPDGFLTWPVDWLTAWGDVAGRMVGAAILGAVVAGLYVYYRRPDERTKGFAQALILLAPLITMVVMAVGGNVAAAFTLVGTLAIVRFRTVVRDTRDTVYVIFAVAVGMAMGQLAVAVAVIGTLIIGLVVLLIRWLQPGPSESVSSAVLRLVISPPESDPVVYQAVLEQFGARARVLRSSIDVGGKQMSLRLAVQGLDPARSPEALIALLAQPDIEQAAFATEDEVS